MVNRYDCGCMALTVPLSQVEHIKKFLELPDEKFEAFLVALSKAGPQFNVADLAVEVANHLDLPLDLVGGVVGVLGSLYLTKNAEDIPTVAFVEQIVFPTLKRAKAFSPEGVASQWERLRKFLLAALSMENTLGTAAKAGHILTQHERIFVTAGILTDIRPIFHQDVADKPEAALIIHMLRMTQRDNQGEFSDEYFALDSNDIRKIKSLIERAIKKEDTLKKLMRNANVAVLNPKETY
jgi:hypothetical protein